MFNLERAHFILDEMMMNGKIVETNKKVTKSTQQAQHNRADRAVDIGGSCITCACALVVSVLQHILRPLRLMDAHKEEA